MIKKKRLIWLSESNVTAACKGAQFNQRSLISPSTECNSFITRFISTKFIEKISIFAASSSDSAVAVPHLGVLRLRVHKFIFDIHAAFLRRIIERVSFRNYFYSSTYFIAVNLICNNFRKKEIFGLS
jgi:hypothetical protein